MIPAMIVSLPTDGAGTSATDAQFCVFSYKCDCLEAKNILYCFIRPRTIHVGKVSGLVETIASVQEQNGSSSSSLCSDIVITPPHGQWTLSTSVTIEGKHARMAVLAGK